MIFTGKMPDDLTEQDILHIEEAESRAFQISFLNELLRSTRSGKKPLSVDIQHYQKTLNQLEAEGISIRKSWEMSPEELADLLGVDAVVRARIEKARLMSDLESYGIDMSVRIINILTNYQWFPWFPPISSQNKEIVADFSLLEREEGRVLWSISFDKGADWRQPANEIIDDISRRAAKKFPYRL